MENDYVAYYENWYQDRPDYLARMMDRAGMYLYFIVDEVERRNMPAEIALLPAIESAFKPNAYSRAHAAGLWQFIPATGTRFGLKQNWWYDGRRDVIAATRAALDYLEFLHNEFNGDWFLALAAYNAGEKRVQSAIALNERRGIPVDYERLRLKSETRRYVPKLIAFRNIVNDPQKFGVQLATIPNSPFFTVIDTGGQIDLAVLSNQSTININELNALNPAFRRWATDPAGPHKLLVPLEHAESVTSTLRDLPPSSRVNWTRYRIRSGDTLGTIASRYRVSVEAIQSANRMRGTMIRANQTLVIPRPSGPSPVAVAYSNESPLVHHVRSGDTLWSIARRYNVYIGHLATWNAIKVNDVLQLGQKLLVYQN